MKNLRKTKPSSVCQSGTMKLPQGFANLLICDKPLSREIFTAIHIPVEIILKIYYY